MLDEKYTRQLNSRHYKLTFIIWAFEAFVFVFLINKNKIKTV